LVKFKFLRHLLLRHLLLNFIFQTGSNHLQQPGTPLGYSDLWALATSLPESSEQRNNMKTRVIYLSVILLGSVVPPASAEMYLGMSLGASASDLCDQVDTSLDCNKTGAAGKMFAGYKFNPYIGTELAYVTSMGTSMSASGHYYSPHVTFSGFNFSAAGFIPLSDKINLTAKAGMFVWETAGSADNSSFIRETGSDVSLGVGMDVKLTESFTLRGEIDQFGLDSNNATLVSAGLMWSF